MIINYKLFKSTAILYRLAILIVLVIISIFGYRYFHPDETFNIVKLLKLLKSLTVISLALSIVYFATITLFQCIRGYKIHGYFYILALTYSWVAMWMYWLVLAVYPNILFCNQELSNLPFWFNHMSNLLLPVIMMIEALLWVPRPVRLRYSILLSCALVLIYNIVVEVLHVKYEYTLYPHMEKVHGILRYLIYIAIWLFVILVTYLSNLYVRLVNYYIRRLKISPEY
ncbi:unnamed protein product [Schistosoma turkestanicum]|nr:unnamed protein product [Schistosoma turkestanicum]